MNIDFDIKWLHFIGMLKQQLWTVLIWNHFQMSIKPIIVFNEKLHKL